jgi:isoleucyl-tRNA synthetase
VLHRITRDLALLLAPVLCYTADEVWPLVPGSAGSVHAGLFPEAEPSDVDVLARWEPLLAARAAATKALEEARAQKRIASSLEAQLELRGGASELEPLRRYEAQSGVFPGNLANLFIVSRVALSEARGPLSVGVERAPGRKCERCWTFSESVGALAAHPAVCERCAPVLEAL